MKKELLTFIQQKLTAAIEVALLYVVYSAGSSPGRQGFHMVVAADQEFQGSIGGGIMEHKWVEYAKDQLQKKATVTILRHQYHDKEHPSRQSGMICSGHQIIACCFLSQKDRKCIAQIIQTGQDATQRLQLSPQGLSLQNANSNFAPSFHFESEEDWAYSESLKNQKTIHIFGAGHVSLALSQLMHFLGFYIKVYDDRSQLNTLEQNTYCHEKHRIDYNDLATFLQHSENDYAVIMTFGYRADKVVVKQLLDKSFFYLGLMGSKAKIKTLIEELKAEGYSSEKIQNLRTPIGLEIHSKTPQEIAISIAAEIIRETNKNLF